MPTYPLYECSLPEAKILADLQGNSNDLHLVMDILTRLLSAQNDVLLSRALFSAGLITYRRCFNSGVRQGLARADIVALPNNAIELHDYLIAQANKLIAHSVNPFEQTKVGVLVIDEQVAGVATASAQLVVFDESGIRQWVSLVKLIGNTVLNPRVEAARAAVSDAVKTLPVADLSKAPILRYQAPGPEQAGKRRS